MSWRDEKADYLQKSRDFSFLHDDRSGGSRDVQRSGNKKVSADRVPDNQEARDRLLRLKALEKQRAAKQKKQYVGSPSPGRDRDDHHHYEQRRDRETADRNSGPSGSKQGLPVKDNFGSFFGKVEKVVAKRVVDEKRAREIAARAAREAEAEKVAKARAESRNGSSMRPPSRPAAKPKPVNPVTVKAQKLKDNRDYSFLFSDEPPSKPEGRDSRAEPSKALKDVRGSAEGSAKPRPSVGTTQSQKAKAASNGGVRPQGSSVSVQARKAGASSMSRPGSGGERDGGGRDSRYENEKRAEKDSRNANGGRAERDTRESRYDTERRPERSVPSSRVGSASKSGGLDERSLSRGLTSSKLPLASDRAKRDGQERAKSVGPKATNHDRAVSSRDSLSMKQSKVTQSSGQRISQSGNGGVRERMVQKSTVERRVVSQSVRGIDESSAMKRKMVGEPAKKASINAKSNDGRRVERSRYEHSDSDPDSEMRSLVAGGPRPGASRIAPASVNGLKRKPSDELRKKPLDAPTRRPMAEEPMRRKLGANEPLPRKSSDELRRRASDEPMRSRPAPAKVKPKRVRDLDDSEYESDSDGGGRVRASGVSSIIQKMFRYNPNKYRDLDDEDDKNMETSFRHIQAEEKRSARLAREEDEREQELIEEEERQERLRKLKRQKSR